jgi:phosphoribosyl 1,2-cyclic phosphodiesterase
VSTGKDIIIIDSGTGIIKLGHSLMKKEIGDQLSLHLFLTHFHLDHIMGLPFFSPLYSPKVKITFYAPPGAKDTERYLSGLMSEKYFPIKFKQTKSLKIFKKIPEGNFNIGGFNISHCPLNHPQGSLAFRFLEKKRNVIFATDTEHYEKGIDEKLVSFAHNAYLFIYDATFTPSEFKSGKRGWGHSTWLEGTKLASQAKVSNLYLSHFNPFHYDSKIDGIVSQARKEFPRTYGAREGLKKTF